MKYSSSSAIFEGSHQGAVFTTNYKELYKVTLLFDFQLLSNTGVILLNNPPVNIFFKGLSLYIRESRLANGGMLLLAHNNTMHRTRKFNFQPLSRLLLHTPALEWWHDYIIFPTFDLYPKSPTTTTPHGYGSPPL